MEQALNAFKKYVDEFDKKNPNIALKIAHTYRVVELALELSKRLDLNEQDTNLLMLIGLLHDIGRFYQVQLHDSYSDFLFDHATYGVKYLFEEGHIRDFITDDTNDEIIKNAIYYHNRHTDVIPKFNDRMMMFVKLIRDIDKIDIYFAAYLKAKTIFSRSEITASCLEEFKNKKLVHKIADEKKSDNFICLCAFIYDFNYCESVEILEKGYVDMYFSNVKVLDNADLFEEIKQSVLTKMNEYLER